MPDALPSYLAYKDSGVPWLGDVPAHWDLQRLKHVCRFVYGDSLPQEGRQPGEIPVFGSNGRVGWHNVANTLQPCLIIGRKGSFGKVNYSHNRVFAIDTTFFVDSRSTTANLQWLHYLLNWVGLDTVSRDSAVPGLDREEAYQRVLPVAPMGEQSAIARYLDHVDRRIRRAIRAKQKLIALLDEQKQGIIHQAVTRGLDPNVRLKPSGVEWLGEVPEHWEMMPVRRLISFITSGSRGWAQFYSDDGDLFVQSGNLGRSMSLDFTRIHRVQVPPGVEGRRTRIEKNDVLVCITGALTGNVAFVQEDLPPAYINQHIALLRPEAGMVLPRFLAYALHSSYGQAQFKVTEYGGTKQGLGLDDVRNVVVTLPATNEQVRIVEALDNRLNQFVKAMDRVKNEIALLREYRTRLIADVVTGKVDVRAAAAGLVQEAEEMEPLDELDTPVEDEEDEALDDKDEEIVV